MTEEEKVREQIARIRCLHCEEYSHHKESCLLTPNVTPFCPEALSIAEQILSLKGIEIRADDQSLPEIMCRNAQAELVIRGYDLAQQEMKEAGFIKVIPKEE